MEKRLVIFMVAVLMMWGCAEKAPSSHHGVAQSVDAVQIAYTAAGAGEPALVFIHGWSCDGRYWQNQIPAFSSDYRVVTIDLAGHGHSSLDRADFTMKLFAEDVKAVMEKEDINKAILIGHSMGGAVIAEAAKLMPRKVFGIIGIDTFHNVAEQLPQAALDQMVNPFEADFRGAVHDFVSPMFLPDADPDLVNWVKADMGSAPKTAAISAFHNYLGRYVSGEAAAAFGEIRVPVVSINARLWPTNETENRKHIKDYKLMCVEHTGHFPMLEKPDAFNAVLKQAIGSIQGQR